MNFYKLEGAGNDFVLFNSEIPSENPQLLVQKICNRQRGIGADGVIFCYQDSSNIWQWRFFNSDGGEVHVCGNACRCVANWIAKTASSPKETLSNLDWKGRLGLFEAKLINDSWFVTWPMSSTEIPVPKDVEAICQDIPSFESVHFFNLGNPHIVINTSAQITPELREKFSLRVRNHDSLPEGANVSWINRGNSSAVTFEKGVELETLACGSGAIACFLSKKVKNSKLNKDFFDFPGGRLSVEILDAKIWLGGPSRIVFQGDINL